ncbi:hypothetical protein Clacol_002760 [Clathrus columnatus]|uniref:Uncharacterized protein n=1 Tax=Clathrus columnatus TaxID=1419009 RepID=A0AAV5A4J7_9AGAM|nr:hypothetical protein Clacol_002760 [Clathrus columnatus]
MPATKFLFPRNMDNSLVANQTFTVQLIVTNLQTGNFANPQTNFMAAPAQVNDKGHLIGHSHIVIQPIPSLNSTDVPDPRQFVFFQGLNGEAVNSILSANVTGGLPPGDYRMGSITTATNHQPALVGIAQHGMLDDTIYFTVQPANQTSNTVALPQSPAKRSLPAPPMHRSPLRFARALSYYADQTLVQAKELNILSISSNGTLAVSGTVNMAQPEAKKHANAKMNMTRKPEIFLRRGYFQHGGCYQSNENWGKLFKIDVTGGE